MPASSTLLVSSHPRLTRTVQQAHDRCRPPSTGDLRGPGEGPRRFKAEDLALVLIHLTPETDLEEVRKLLREAAACPAATTALICDTEATAAQGRALLLEGAADLVCLPADSAKLVELMTTAGRRGGPPSRHPSPEATSAPPEPSELMLVEPEHLAQVRQVVDQDTTILLTGETGTGKTMLARHIHQLSARQNRPFLVVDCGALAPALIESEMFGHVRGAFTGADNDRVGKFAAAGDGTLVLDEINSLPAGPPGQAAPGRRGPGLRAGRVEPVAAAAGPDHRHHERLAARRRWPQDRFRADLYYRLNVVGFRLPPLRERRADILPAGPQVPVRARGRPGPRGDRDLPRGPGGSGVVRLARERPRAPERDRTRGRPLHRSDRVPERPARRPSGSRPPAVGPGGRPGCRADPVVAGPDDELWRICEALRKHRNNRVRAAAELGMSRVSLYKKLHKYGLFEKTPAGA